MIAKSKVAKLRIATLRTRLLSLPSLSLVTTLIFSSVAAPTLSPQSHNSFKIHQNYTHDVDVVRNYCDIDGCQYWAKQMGELKNHQK